MNIAWRLYDDDELVADDPLGSITITDPDGARINQDATYLDSWFQALLQGVRSLEAGEEESIEMVEEPDPLELSVEGPRLRLKHDQSTVDLDMIVAIEEIRKQAQRFLLLMQTLDDWESNPTLREIERELGA